MNGWVRTSVEGPAELLPVAEVVGSPVGRADAIRVSERWSVTMDSGSWASWPTRLLCGGGVVLLHLLLAWGLWQPTPAPAPLQRPQPEVVSVRWLAEPPAQTPTATPVPPAAVRQPPPPPVVEPPVVKQAAKPRPVATKPKVKAHPRPNRSADRVPCRLLCPRRRARSLPPRRRRRSRCRRPRCHRCGSLSISRRPCAIRRPVIRPYPAGLANRAR